MVTAHRLRSWVNELARAAGDWLLPPFCVLCGPLADDGALTNLCDACAERLILFAGPEACRVCALPLVHRPSDPRATCVACERRRPPYERLVACAPYAGVVRELIAKLKYGKDTAAAAPIAVLFKDSVTRLVRADPGFRADVICPMPLSKTRRRERGFNQAELIARDLPEALGAPMERHLLCRVADRTPQAALSRSARAEISADLFEVQGVYAKKVILIDDVVTTGATMRAASRALKKHGALEVRCLAFARTS